MLDSTRDRFTGHGLVRPAMWFERGLSMAYFFNRAGSVGPTMWWTEAVYVRSLHRLSWVADSKPLLKATQLLVDPFDLPSEARAQGYEAVLVFKIGRVLQVESLLSEFKESVEVLVTHEGLAQVVDLLPLVVAVGVRLKGDGAEGRLAWGEIKHLPGWALPDGMELGFDEYTGPLPEGPAQRGLPAGVRHLLFDGGKAVARHLAWNWLAANPLNRLFKAHFMAEGDQGRAVELGSNEHVSPLQG